MIGLSTHPWLSGLFGDAKIAAIFEPEAELQRFLTVEAAWAAAMGKVAGQDVTAVVDKIKAAAIKPADLLEGCAKDGVPIPALVRLLKEHVGEDNTVWVHQGLTSQDVIDTALVLAVSQVLSMLMLRLKARDGKLTALSGQHAQVRLMAYTRMQPALETSAPDVIARWRQPVASLIARAAEAEAGVKQVQYGGPIGARDHPNASKLGAAFAQALELRDAGAAWHTERRSLVLVANVLAEITTLTGKIGADVALMAAVGPEQIALSGGGSSAMSHKTNPVSAEVLTALSDHAIALHANMLRAARHEGFRSGHAWTLEWLTLAPLCTTAGASLLRAGELLESIQTIGRVEGA